MNFLPFFGRRSAWRAPCARCVLLLALFGCVPLAALGAGNRQLRERQRQDHRSAGRRGPGARVTARQIETNTARDAVSDTEGRFRFPYLRLGPYEISVEHAGFSGAMRRLDLTVGAAFDLPIRLELEAVAASVTVSGTATVLEAARSQIAGTISRAEVASLPLNGRNFLDIALLVPGVSPTNVGGTQLFAETSAVPGSGLSVGSQRNFSNNFIVDGLSANDDAAGLSGMPYGVDAVDQFQVVTSGGQAELGRALGGYVNVVTRSGTNLSRGDLYGYFRDDAFNGRNALSGTKLPMSQQQYGGSLGGPITRDRTFFFANGEQRLLDQTGLATITDANVATINSRLAAVGYAGSPVVTGIYPNPVHSVNVLGKIDHQFNGSDHFSVRYSLYDVDSSNSRGAGGLNAPSASAALNNRDQTIAFSNTLTLSPSDGERDARPVRIQRSAGAADRSRRAVGEHRRCRGIRHAVEQPDRPPEQDVSSRQQPVAPGRGARAACRSRLSLQRRPHHLSARRARRVHVLVARELPQRYLQQRRVHPDLRRERRRAGQRRMSACTCRTSGAPARA